MSDTTFRPALSTPVHHGYSRTTSRTPLASLRAGVRRGHAVARQVKELVDTYSLIETGCLLVALVASSAIVISAIAGARF